MKMIYDLPPSPTYHAPPPHIQYYDVSTPTLTRTFVTNSATQWSTTILLTVELVEWSIEWLPALRSGNE